MRGKVTAQAANQIKASIASTNKFASSDNRKSINSKENVKLKGSGVGTHSGGDSPRQIYLPGKLINNEKRKSVKN